jgi:hypothetical protein
MFLTFKVTTQRNLQLDKIIERVMVTEGRIEKTVPGIFPLMKQPMWVRMMRPR